MHIALLAFGVGCITCLATLLVGGAVAATRHDSRSAVLAGAVAGIRATIGDKAASARK